MFCASLSIGRSRSLKVVDFGTNWRGIYDFLLVIYSNIGPILHRFWNTTTYWLKMANYSYPTLIRCPSLEWSLSNFWMNIFIAKTPWAVRLCRFRKSSFLRFDTVPACDRQTDRRTDYRTVANTGLCIICWRHEKISNIVPLADQREHSNTPAHK